MPQADAGFIITASNLYLGNVSTAGSLTIPAGKVISQNPPGSSTAASFSTVNLVVSVGAPPYASWQTANNTGGDFDLDHDNDGVPNGIEYFLGGATNTTGFTALPGVANHSVTWVKAATYPGTYGTDYWVETADTLSGTWTPETLGGNATLTGNDVKYTYPNPLGTRKFARLRVTAP